MSDAAKTTADQPPRCPMRVINCGRYEVVTEPPAEPRIWACAHPDCSLAVSLYGDEDDE